VKGEQTRRYAGGGARRLANRVTRVKAFAPVYHACDKLYDWPEYQGLPAAHRKKLVSTAVSWSWLLLSAGGA